MARVSSLPREELGEYEDFFQVLERAMGFVPNSALTMARRPPILEGFNQLGRAVLLDPGTVDAGLKWLVAHLSSRASGCRYCWAHTGSNAAAAAGVPVEKVEAAWDFETSPLFSDSERAALRLAIAAGVTPNAVEDDHFDELSRYFNEDQIVEIVAAIALFGFLNRWNDTLGTDLEDIPLSFGDEHLREGGWQPRTRSET